MTDGPWVLDTSVAAAWFFTDESFHVEALVVQNLLRDEPSHFVVPSVFYSELTHVLARKSGRDASFVGEALTLMFRLGVRTLMLSESALLRAGYWACRGLSGYDATFVALAEDVAGRWLTGDVRAAKLAGSEAAEILTVWAQRNES